MLDHFPADGTLLMQFPQPAIIRAEAVRLTRHSLNGSGEVPHQAERAEQQVALPRKGMLRSDAQRKGFLPW